MDRFQKSFYDLYRPKVYRLMSLSVLN